MNTVSCRHCRHEVSPTADFCPECGAPRPALPEWNGVGFEWTSARSIGGWPLLHIAFGTDPQGRLRVARGVFALGQRAIGGIAVGVLATGIVACGVVCGGVVSFGIVAVGLVFACGVNALAPIAVGVVACGVAVGGLQAFGWKLLFSVSR